MPKVELRNQGTSSTDSTTDTAGTQTILPNYRSRNKGKNKLKINVLFLLVPVTIINTTTLLYYLICIIKHHTIFYYKLLIIIIIY